MNNDLNKIFKPTPPVTGDELTSYLNKKSDQELTRKIESALSEDDFLNDALDGLKAAQENNIDFSAISFALNSKAPVQKKSDYRFFWMAAASILIIFSIALFLNLDNSKLVQQDMAVNEPTQKVTNAINEETGKDEIKKESSVDIPKEVSPDIMDKLSQVIAEQKVPAKDLETLALSENDAQKEKKSGKTISDATDETISISTGSTSTGVSGGTFANTQSQPSVAQNYEHAAAADKGGESLSDDNVNTTYEYKAKEEQTKKSVSTKSKSKTGESEKNVQMKSEESAYRADERKAQAPSKEIVNAEDQKDSDSDTKSNRNNNKTDVSKNEDSEGTKRNEPKAQVTTTSPAVSGNANTTSSNTVNTEQANQNTDEADWAAAIKLEKQAKTKELKKLLKKIAKSKSKYAKTAQQKLDKLP